MNTIQWIFDGIGSQIVGLIVGFIVGGGAGYSIAVHKQSTKIRQTQKAKDNANQQQAGIINNYGSN